MLARRCIIGLRPNGVPRLCRSFSATPSSNPLPSPPTIDPYSEKVLEELLLRTREEPWAIVSAAADLLHFLHESVFHHWTAVIVGAAFATRLLSLPLTLYQMNLSQRMVKSMPQMTYLMTRIQRLTSLPQSVKARLVNEAQIHLARVQGAQTYKHFLPFTFQLVTFMAMSASLRW